MCGIFGLVQATPFDARELGTMSRLMRHRGPDDEGIVVFASGEEQRFGGPDTPRSSYESRTPYRPVAALPMQGSVGNGGVAIGHRRLAIIDLSALGHQPMRYRDRYWISYNGEVYNYLELRSELRTAGYSFESDADTEVIAAAYDHWGPDCLHRFNGMWGLAILDTVKCTLFLARDRFGVKPLYLFGGGGRLAFASEIKAFSALNRWRARANRARLLDFLLWNISDHTDETMFEGVRQLPAGHHLTIDVEPVLRAMPNGLSPIGPPRRWYSLPSESTCPSSADAVATLRELLDDAVRLRLRSDRTVGSCLSGGLDSSSIVCLMGKQLRSRGANDVLHTFTARSHDAEFDESRYADAVVSRAGATSHQITPEPAALFKDLERLTWHQDEPFVSTSIFAQWSVFGAARAADVIVMLDGQGADETLGGYRGFFGAYLAGLARHGRFGTWFQESTALRREIGFSRARSLGYTLAYLQPAALGLIGRFDHRAYANRDWVDATCLDGFREDPVRTAGGRPSSVREMSIAQIVATNLPMLLRWEDRNSMAHSIEARVPFLDYRVVEHCLCIADKDKLGGGIAKLALRQSMRGLVPDLVLDRRDKMGFVTAERLWVTRDMAARFREELVLASEALQGIVSPLVVDQFDQVVAKQRPFDHRYWRVISAGRWIRVFGVQQ